MFSKTAHNRSIDHMHALFGKKRDFDVTVMKALAAEIEFQDPDDKTGSKRPMVKPKGQKKKIITTKLPNYLRKMK